MKFSINILNVENTCQKDIGSHTIKRSNDEKVQMRIAISFYRVLLLEMIHMLDLK